MILVDRCQEPFGELEGVRVKFFGMLQINSSWEPM